MSDRQNWSRLVAAIFALTLVSAFAFATIAPRSFTSLFTAEAQVAPATESAAAPADDPEGGPACTTAGPIEVQSSGGTTTPTAYANLGAGFAAINAGTHQGIISIEVCASTNEGTTPATLHSSGAGPATYASVSIVPLGDALTISGNPVTGFGVIQLNGADNVTINGDNPNSAGTNRNLTVSNTTTSTVIANSAVRIATSASAASADNNTIKNLILLGNVTGGNAAAITSTTGSSNSSFGIYIGGNGGATATTEPTAITSVTAQTAPAGTTVNNLMIDNNVVNQAARAIVFNGGAASVSNGVTISNNLIGDQGTATPATPPYTAPATTVYTKGIWVAGTSSVVVTGNSLKNILSYVGTTMTAIEILTPAVTNSVVTNNTVNTLANNGPTSIAKAILISSTTAAYTIAGNTVTNVQTFAGASGTAGIEVTAAATSGTIERNKVQTVYGRSTGTFGAYGINLTAGTGIVLKNNFVSDINMDMTGGAAFSTQFSVHGIRIAGGTNHKVYHNTVNLFGALLGTPTTSIMTSALEVTVIGVTGLDIRNNILSNTMTGGTTSIAHVSMFLPPLATSAMNLTLNNNDYFSGPDAARQGIGQVGVTAGAGFYLASNFNAGATTPATNLRAYTSTLSAAGTNDNASKVVDPLLVSNTDLHIQSASSMESMGVSVGVTDDIDGQVRPNGPVPDIGADEIPLPLAPGALQFSGGAFSGSEGNMATMTVNRSGGSLGSVTVDYATVAGGTATGGASCGGSVDYVNASGTLTFPDGVTSQTFMVQLCSDAAIEGTETVNMQLSNATGGATIGAQSTAVLSITDVVIFTGPIDVGSGQTFTSLTNPGGVFESLNGGIVTGNVVINLTSDLTTETGAVFLNQLNEQGGGAGTYTVTIKPSAAPRVISGTSAGALIRINGADRVTIDGSTSGGSDRSLTITNNSTATNTAAIHISSLGAGAGSTNVTIKNANLSCGSDQSLNTNVTYGISQGGALLGNSGADNDNNTFTNLAITKVNIGIYSSGENAANQVQGTAITNNLIGPAAFGADQIGRAGIIFNLTNGATVTGNEVRFVGVLEPQTSSGGSYDKFGISHAFNGWSDTTSGDLAVSNTLTARNRVHDIVEENTFSAVGIFMAGGNGANDTLNTTVNNFIWNVRADGTSGDNSVSLGIASGKGDVVAYNTIYSAGDLDPGVSATASQSSFGLQITSTTAVNLTLKDNIVFTDMTSNTATLKHGSIKIPASFAWGTGGSNFNDLYVPAANTQAIVGRVNLTDALTLADWQTATTQDANSKSVDPLFVSATDLHIQGTSTLIAMGNPVVGVTTDIDGDPRDASTPEIGADELFTAVPGTLAFSSATYSVGEAGPTATLTVNRTGGSDGAVNVDYALSGGTASGGAACGAGVDYVNAGGTLMFANGETTKNIVVAVCEDSVFEGDETFNATLSNATGGATIGAPNPAAVTITENEGVPTVQFSSATYTTAEGVTDSASGIGVTINVTLSGASQGITSVAYATVAGGTATGGATCAAGVDYFNTSGTLNIPPGMLGGSFFVETCVDAIDEPDETFNIALSAPVGATLGTPNAAVVTITDNDLPAGPITVTATAGTPGPTSYTTLKDAVDAINAGTHQGAIVVSVNSNTTETATSVLNSSGAGTASYTSILIQPTADGLTIAGASVIGRGLIELNGADNVTIDGDNPNSAGINRNLTIQNTAANTVTFTSVIRIALAISVVNTADNDTFKNLNIVGSATGRNIAAANTTTGSENTTFGILAGTGASTTTATAAPAAIVSVSTGVAAGGTANNLTISNNNIVTAARAVSINGTATSVFPGLLINTNSIGNAVAGNADQVTAMGIVASGSTNAVIAANTVYVEGWVPASASTHGIDVGINSTAISGTTIEKNGVNRVKHNNPGTWTAIGINLGGGNNHAVRNNFVSGILNDQVAGTGAFGTTFGAYGIRIGSGTGHTVYHNSVHLYGAMGGVVSTNLTAAFLMSATTQTGVDVRNNIFSNQVTGGNPATPGTRNVAIALPSGGTSAMNLTLNNNAYFVSSDALSRMAQVGVTFGVGEYQAADFDPTSTTPATNFRAYSSTLSAAGTNDNASFATATAPPFTSNTNLHIPAATATRLESGGAAVGVLDDIDLETRAATPDIGADEFAGSPAPANDIGASGFINPVPGSNVPTGAVFTPQARFVNNGTAPQTNVPVRFRIVNSSMVEVYNQTAMISSIAPLQQVTVSFPATSVAAAGAYTMFASSELAGDSNPGNDSINAGFTAVTPIAGTINVGAGETYTSLTNAGGLFAALNAAGISGSVTVNITTDLTGETGAVALNQLAEAGSGGYTVTIKPSGAARTISGTSAASSGLIILSGADRIIFDGSLSGGTDRSLTITNNQATTGIVIWMRSPSASNGATNNTIKNCIINGAPGPNSTTVAGILTGSSVTLGGDAESPNSNNIVQNNWIYRVQNALYLRGGLTAPVFDQNWTVTGNELGSTVAADKNIFRGMLIGNAANFTISGNTVHGIQSTTTTTAAMSGIQLGLLLSNGTVTNNQISDIKNVSATGTGAYGISVIATSTASNVTIANNFVSDIAANGSATVASNGHGIGFTSLAPGGSGYNLYFNSVNLNTNQTTAQTSAAMFIAATFNVAGAINARNNIFSNSETTGTRYGVYSLAPASVFSPIDYNDYFAQNVGFIGGSARVALADWQTGTGQDANSKSVDPLFVSSTDLHIQAASTLINMGVAGTGITTDIDGQARDATPDIGADEVPAVAMPGSLQFSSATYSVGEAGGTATLTVTRTGGSDGTVTVNFATVAGGTATGGASCSAGVDYIDTIGGLTFLNGETSKLLSVPICNDTAVEPSETVNVGLSSPTGGATIGTPSTAVVTINDDDLPAGTLSISDVRMLEGNSGAKNFVFTVTYSGSAAPASVQYATANGTATSGVDYLAASGTLNFPVTLSPEGVIVPQTATITVVVGSDVTKEATEVFFVNLSNPVGATITDGQGLGIIVDDDKATVADFDLDHMSDISVFRPSEGRWYILQSASLTPKIVTFGQVGDIAVPGDYDGDGISDVAIWRSSDTSWYRILSSTGTTVIDSWGTAGDKPVQGDYDGDGKTDLAVFRPSTGTWWILRSSNGTSSSIPFGISTDRLVQGDYDGDAKTDVAVYRDGTWYVVRSSDSVVQIANFGLASDKPISGDFDGDGKYDLAIYRNGEWWVLRSLTGTATAVPWGTGTDIPVPADYDSDGTTDLAVFRPSTGNWFIIRSSNSSAFGLHWGESGDVPIPAAYIPQ